jgi:crossover junction endodeoxyribonuclease RusA
MIEITVYGQPAAQGSKRHVGHGVMVEMSKKVAPWRQDVKAAAEKEMTGRPALAGPLHLSVCFTLPKPKSAPKRRQWPATRPDLDKLVRSTLDGLTGPLFADDALVVRLDAMKVYLGHDDALQWPGAQIWAWELEER